jgi:anti-sigma-K factor RskA
MEQRTEIDELLPFYALDALNEEERKLVEEYLAEHPEARQQLEEMDRAASALPHSVIPVEPPRRIREILMRRVDSDERARLSRQVSPRVSHRALRLENILRVLSFGAATIAILWAFLLNAQVSRLQEEISTLNDRLVAQSQSLEQIVTSLPQTNRSDVITVSLKGTDVQPQAHGQLIADPKEQSAVLVITGLPPLEPGKTYQVWLIGNAPVSAGLLTVDENGQSVLIVTSEAPIGSFNSLGISVEPEGGSQQPTGEIVVLSDL